MDDLGSALNTAVEAARLAGDFQRSQFRVENESGYKGLGDPVSEIDHRSERLILEHIADRYPSHAVLSEERGEVGGDDARWIVDPLDGTSNYLRGLPDFCVSIALEIDGECQLGVVYRPMSDDLYGATLDGHRADDGVTLGAAETTEMEHALVAIPYSSDPKDRSAVWDAHREFGSTVEGIRSTGSGALDLAYVASGVIDAAYAFNQGLWDRAAGKVLIKAAGGRVSDHSGGRDHGEDFLASNGPLHESCLDRMRS